MTEFNTGYNGHRYASHFQCRQYLYNIVYTHARKTDAKHFFDKTINIIENQYKGKVRYIQLDGETSLRNMFKNIVTEKGIKLEYTAPNILAQNGSSEQSRKV